MVEKGLLWLNSSGSFDSLSLSSLLAIRLLM